MKTKVSNTSMVSNIVFILTITIVGLSTVSVIFPALISSITSPYDYTLNPFELGPNYFPFIIINIILIGIVYFYYKKKLPKLIKKYFDFVRNFETSRNVTIIVVVVILLVYVGLTFPELFLTEEDWIDYKVLDETIKIWPFGESDNSHVNEHKQRYVRMLLLIFSHDILENIKIVPFIASISLVLVTFFFTVQITKKRFAGIISMIVLLQSYTFLQYDTMALYTNFWILFYLLSLYTIQKKWYLSSMFYAFAFFSKSLIAPFLAMNVFFLYGANIETKKKLLLLGSYVAVIILILILGFGEGSVLRDSIEINFSEFWSGFTFWANQMRLDYFMSMTILPLVIGLYFISRRGIKEADSILFLIFGSLMSAPLLSMVTDFFVFYPYHFVSFIVFFSIGVGVLLSKRTT